jgi:hypothetical protein
MRGIVYFLWKSKEYVLPLASVIYLPLRRRKVTWNPKQQQGLEIWMSNIVDQHDSPIDQGSDDRNTFSVHDQNGEALRCVTSTITVAFPREHLLTSTTHVLQKS